MKCPRHSQADVIGYCSVCGDFGCSDCMTTHDGQLLCPKHYRPIAQKIEEERRQQELRKRHPRQRLVVRFADGRCLYGMSYALNPKDAGFHLDLVGPDGIALGKSEYIRFQDLKAVFMVKSFDGKYDKTARYREWTPEGGELYVVFRDGEELRGFSLQRFSPDEPRFHLIPFDPTTNNINILVEMAAVERVFTPEQYQARLAEEREVQKATGAPVTLTQEETTGDFYFETRNYPAAFQQYRLAMEKAPRSSRLQKKLLSAQFNVAIGHIKRHEYDKALAHMEAVLRADPHNERVKKKVIKLRYIIRKGGTVSEAEEP